MLSNTCDARRRFATAYRPISKLFIVIFVIIMVIILFIYPKSRPMRRASLDILRELKVMIIENTLFLL